MEDRHHFHSFVPKKIRKHSNVVVFFLLSTFFVLFSLSFFFCYCFSVISQKELSFKNVVKNDFRVIRAIPSYKEIKGRLSQFPTEVDCSMYES